jgi:hypothetical protein
VPESGRRHLGRRCQDQYLCHRLREHAMPCHHALVEALRAYIDAAGIAEDRKGWLFRTARGHKADILSDREKKL